MQTSDISVSLYEIVFVIEVAQTAFGPKISALSCIFSYVDRGMLMKPGADRTRPFNTIRPITRRVSCTYFGLLQ